ncbi:MAG: hypothetical protein WCG06_01505, partial [Candidatus Omnitrophota bacterium]
AILRQLYRGDGILVSAGNSDERLMKDLLWAAHVASIEQYRNWVQLRLRYSKNTAPGPWRSCGRILDSGAGDCEDFMSVHCAALSAMGFRPGLLALEGADWGHAICYFKKDGLYSFFDNERLIVTQSTSRADFFARLKDLYGYERLYELDIVSKNSTRLDWALSL